MLRLVEDEIASLIVHGTLARFPPLRSPESEIQATYRTAIRDIGGRFNVRDKTEWNDYGSGYASFIDAWFYFPDGRARASSRDERHFGVFVLLSRLSCFYVVGQGEKAWTANAASSYLPDLTAVDTVSHPALVELERGIDQFLSAMGMRRLGISDLQIPISPHHYVPTIMSDAPFTQFDALFYWAD